MDIRPIKKRNSWFDAFGFTARHGQALPPCFHSLDAYVFAESNPVAQPWCHTKGPTTLDRSNLQ